MKKKNIAGLGCAGLMLGLLGALPGTTASASDAAGNPVVLAVGDMACDTSDPNFNGGVGTATHCAEQRVSDQMLKEIPAADAVLGLGDYQYSCGDPTDWQNSYDLTYGRLNNSLMEPIVGNHEYDTTDPYGGTCPVDNTTAATYFSHFTNSHPDATGHYTFSLGSWRIIGLNAECNKNGVGGCGATSPETTWLKQQLAANTQPCILAMWHQPRWWSGGNATAYGPWWQALYKAHADVVLNGHVHNYQRFRPLNYSGAADPTNGITEYIVGTGGEETVGFKAPTTAALTPLAKQRTFGYLRMSLSSTGWSAAFVDSTGAVLDTSSGTCHP
jgi:Calcineurin-like phosphoesterase